MRSQFVVLALHLVLLSCLGVWSHRGKRWRWALALLAIPLLSWWWISDPRPRDGPDWLIVVLVSLYTAGIFFAASAASRRVSGVRAQLLVTMLSAIAIMYASSFLTFLVWGVADAL